MQAEEQWSNWTIQACKLVAEFGIQQAGSGMSWMSNEANHN